MSFKFKDRKDPVYTTEPYYDLFDGGYIDPEDLLEDEEQAKEVREAISTIIYYLNSAENRGIIKTY